MLVQTVVFRYSADLRDWVAENKGILKVWGKI